jgi:hypothetical protein
MRKIYRDKGLLLIPLPGNRGLNIGRKFTGYCSIREWPWAVYDFADHVSPWSNKADWADSVLADGYPILCTGCKGMLDVDRVESHYINPYCDDCNMDLAIAQDHKRGCADIDCVGC